MEHRFVYAAVTGLTPEHVHHINHQKLDNRPENLEGHTASAHTSYHGLLNDPTRKAKRSAATKRRWRENPQQFLYKRGPLLKLSKVWLETELAKVDGHPTKVAEAHKIDYTTLMKYIDAHGVACKRRDTRPDARGGNHLIIFVERLTTPVDVYDLQIEETENFIAGEVCVHNSMVDPNLQNVIGDKGSGEGATLAAGFRSVVVARGRWVEEGSGWEDVGGERLE